MPTPKLNKEPTNGVDQDKSNPNRLKRAALGTTALVMGGLTLALTGCAPGNAEGKDPNEGVDTTTEVVVDTPSIPELITQHETLSYTEFNQLPQGDRLAYVDYKLEENKEDHASLLAYYEDEGIRKPTYVSLALDSSAQDIVDNYIYVSDDANLQSEVVESGDRVHDVDEGIKMLSGAYFNVTGDSLSRSYLNEIDIHQAHEGEKAYSNESNLTATGTSGIQTGEKNGTPVTYQDITFTNNLGENLVGRWIQTDFINVDGENETTWLLDQTGSEQAPLPNYQS